MNYEAQYEKQYIAEYFGVSILRKYNINGEKLNRKWKSVENVDQIKNRKKTKKKQKKNRLLQHPSRPLALSVTLFYSYIMYESNRHKGSENYTRGPRLPDRYRSPEYQTSDPWGGAIFTPML